MCSIACSLGSQLNQFRLFTLLRWFFQIRCFGQFMDEFGIGRCVQMWSARGSFCGCRFIYLCQIILVVSWTECSPCRVSEETHLCLSPSRTPCQGQYLPFYESACLSVLKHVCKYVLDTTFPFTIMCLRYNFHRICLVIALQKLG